MDARTLAFAMVRMAAKKHGENRYARALRFAKRAQRKARRLSVMGVSPMWDEVIVLLQGEVAPIY